MDEEIFSTETSSSEDTEIITPITSDKNYRILDENDDEIFDPNLEIGYLKEETLNTYHEAIPEKGHYFVNYLELNTGEKFFLEEGDPRIEIINEKTGAFKYLPGEEDPSIQIKSASIKYIIDQPKINAYETKETILRYILYTEKELADNIFLAEGPERLNTVESDTNDLFEVVAELAGSDIEDRVAENQETLDDILLVMADLLGGAEEEI